MPYTSAEAQQQLADALAEAITQIGFALADLGAAYEQLDEHNADRLEAELFGPVQRAYEAGREHPREVRRSPRPPKPHWSRRPRRASLRPACTRSSTARSGRLPKRTALCPSCRTPRCRRKSGTRSCELHSRTYGSCSAACGREPATSKGPSGARAALGLTSARPGTANRLQPPVRVPRVERSDRMRFRGSA